MVFPSVPAYLDPPNWNNQQGQQPGVRGGGGGRGDAPHLPVGSAAVAAPLPEAGGLSSSSSAGAAVAQLQHTRPNSMAERARLARMPQPEPALRCPRCDSTNTKFCYYNNYSLSQPRHFCKACRRYWTRGGALRNVPVGGGCRRNKRSSKSSSSAAATAAAASSSSSKPSSSARQLPGGPSSMPSTAAAGMGPGAGAIIPPGLSSMSHHLPFLGPMNPPGPSLGLAFAPGHQPLGMHHVDAADQFPVASAGGSTIGASLEHWRMQQQPQQQFPFLGGGVLELPPPPMYQMGVGQLEAARPATGAAAAFTLAQPSAPTARQEGSMKLEDSKGQEMNLQRQYMAALRQGAEGTWGDSASDGGGGNNGNGSSGWTMNIPGFHSSSTGDDCGGLL